MKRLRLRRVDKVPAIYEKLWYTWTSSMDKPRPKVKWSRIVGDIKRAAHYCDDARDYMFILHIVCALYPPLDVVMAVAEANPKAIDSKSQKGGLTPLMIACGSGSRPEVVKYLCEKCPRVVGARDESGYASIHWATRENVHSDVVSVLLTVDPLLYQQRTSPPSNQSTLAPSRTAAQLLYEDRRKYRHASSWHTQQRYKLMYLLWTQHYGTIDNRSRHNFSIVHAVLACNCPRVILDDFIIDSNVQTSAGTRDSKGYLPIHHAACCRELTRSHVKILLRHYPESVRERGPTGQYPLHMMLDQGRNLENGVDLIYDKDVSVAQERDRASGLPAPLLAARRCDLDTIYLLAREFPTTIFARSYRAI